ncbi:MAG: hypothetical protein J6U54_00365, partial [Clostridiales bacterium]|nr:hypothetical protein [Clostridiales bacterium]
LNTIDVFAVDPNFVLQKVVIVRAGDGLDASYFGPKPTYRS